MYSTLSPHLASKIWLLVLVPRLFIIVCIEDFLRVLGHQETFTSQLVRAAPSLVVETLACWFGIKIARHDDGAISEDSYLHKRRP